MNHYLETCIKSAIAGGRAILRTRSLEGIEKGDACVGHHAVVTKADYNSQKAILRVIQERDPNAFFITEEHVKEDLRDRTIHQGNLDSMRDSRVYVIDELDGTSSRAAGHYEWSVSVGYVNRLQPTAGAIYAPQIFNGTLFYGSLGEGSFVKKGRKTMQVEVSDKGLGKDSYILLGPDFFLPKYPLHNELGVRLGDISRTVNVCGSCAIGLGLVASGTVDALVQPIHSPWDYAGGLAIVDGAKGRFIFYEMTDGKINPIERLEPRHYDPTIRAVGFVAGNTNITEQIMDKLMRLSK